MLRYEVQWTERGEHKAFGSFATEAEANSARAVFLAGARHDPRVDAHSVRVRPVLSRDARSED